MSPALFKGKDYTGEIIGGVVVLGMTGIKQYSSTRRPVWLLKCLGCDAEFNSDPYSAIKRTLGCRKCQGKAMSGVDSPHWKGGRHVPAYFVASFKISSARRARDIPWTITMEELDDVWESQSGKCVYTGWSLAFGTSSTERTASLDRIDSGQGYISGNVQFVHKRINIMKWSLSEEEFLSLCRAVVKNVDR